MSGLEQLGKLVGSWNMSGRTLDSDTDNISGHVTIEWILGGSVLQLKGKMQIKGFEMESLELIWHDATANAFSAHAYTSMGGNPIQYRWDIQGNTLTHSGAGATYSGTISEDGNTITGGWRPDDGKEATDGSAYDVTMVRVE